MTFVVGNVVFNISGDDRKLIADLAEAERAARRAAQNIQSSVGGIDFGGIARGAGQLVGLGAGFSAAQAGINAVRAGFDATVGAGLRLNATLETTELQFQTLTGSASEAKRHVQELFSFASATPFTAEGTIEASRALRTMGGAALDTAPNLTLVGDAAAATSSGIQEVAFWVGRAYNEMQAGRPFGEAAQRLQELGILSGTARNRLESLQASGAKGSEVWAAFAGDLAKFSGAMTKQAQTMDGLTSTFSDNFALLAATATKPIFEGLKGGLKALNDELSKPEAQQGASQMADTLTLIGDAAATAAAAIKDAITQLERWREEGKKSRQEEHPGWDFLTPLDIGFDPTVTGPSLRDVFGAVGLASASGLPTQRLDPRETANTRDAATATDAFTAALTKAQQRSQEMAVAQRVAADETTKEEIRRRDLAGALHQEEQARAAVNKEMEAQRRIQQGLTEAIVSAQRGETVAPTEEHRRGPTAPEFAGGPPPSPDVATPGQIREQIKQTLESAKPAERAALAETLKDLAPNVQGILDKVNADPLVKVRDALRAANEEAQKGKEIQAQAVRDAEAQIRAGEDARIAGIREREQTDLGAVQAEIDANRDLHNDIMDGLRDEAEARQEIGQQRQAQLAVDQREIAAAKSIEDVTKRLTDAQAALAKARTGPGGAVDPATFLHLPASPFTAATGARAQAIRDAQKALDDAKKAAEQSELGQGLAALEAAGLGNAGTLSAADRRRAIDQARAQVATRQGLTDEERQQAEALLRLAQLPRETLTAAQRVAVDQFLSTAQKQGDDAAAKAERGAQKEEDRQNRDTVKELERAQKSRREAAQDDLRSAQAQITAARAQRESAAAWAKILGIDLPPPTAAFGPVAGGGPPGGQFGPVTSPAAASGGTSAPGNLPPAAPPAGVASQVFNFDFSGASFGAGVSGEQIARQVVQGIRDARLQTGATT